MNVYCSLASAQDQDDDTERVEGIIIMPSKEVTFTVKANIALLSLSISVQPTLWSRHMLYLNEQTKKKKKKS